MFSAMTCHFVNAILLCAQPVNTRYDVSISNTTPFVTESINYYFVPSLSYKDAVAVVLGDKSKFTLMNGCKIKALNTEYFYELPCSDLNKIIKCQ